MAVKIKCSACGTGMKVRDELAGKKVRCKQCKSPVGVPSRRKSEGTDEELPFALFSKLENQGQLIGQGPHVTCRNCGEAFASDNLDCTFCGTPVNLEKDDKRRSQEKINSGDSPKGSSSVVVGQIVTGLTVCAFVGVMVMGGLLIKKQLSGGDGTTRVQKEFLGKTTEVWFNHQRKGERPEKLWRDNRWMPMHQVVGLDWAAVPLLLDALTERQTHDLATYVLVKYERTMGTPFVEDLEAGLKHSDEEVRMWAAKLVTKLERPAPELIPLLEGGESAKDEKTGAAMVAAVKHLQSQGGTETKK